MPVFFYLLLVAKQSIRTATKILGVVVLFVPAIWIAVSTPVGMALSNAFFQPLSEGSMMRRIALWQDAIQAIAIQPLVGVGMDWSTDPHNFVLRALMQFGLIGSVPFLFIVFYPLQYLLRLRHLPVESAAVAIAYVAIFVHGLVEPMFWRSVPQVWLGLIIAFLVSRGSHFTNYVPSGNAVTEDGDTLVLRGE